MISASTGASWGSLCYNTDTAAGRCHGSRGRLLEEASVSETDCIFCRIAAGQIPADVVRDDADTVAFRDLDPKAPVHVLVIPRRHIASVNDLEAPDAGLMGALFVAAREVAVAEGTAERGYRLVMNTGTAAGQSVPHVHLHVLGGREFAWPPG
jgi:histidine triad (HIT) family protein